MFASLSALLPAALRVGRFLKDVDPIVVATIAAKGAQIADLVVTMVKPAAPPVTPKTRYDEDAEFAAAVDARVKAKLEEGIRSEIALGTFGSADIDQITARVRAQMRDWEVNGVPPRAR